MWEYEHSVETTAAPDVLWRHWSDMPAWPTWNDGIASIEVDGPFAVGTTFRMTPPGDGEEPIAMRLTEIVPGELFVDELDAGDFVVRTVHRLVPAAGGRTRVVYRTEISGTAAEVVGPRLGPAITADFPDVLAALTALAERPAERAQLSAERAQLSAERAQLSAERVQLSAEPAEPQPATRP